METFFLLEKKLIKIEKAYLNNLTKYLICEKRIKKHIFLDLLKADKPIKN